MPYPRNTIQIVTQRDEDGGDAGDVVAYRANGSIYIHIHIAVRDITFTFTFNDKRCDAITYLYTMLNECP